VVVHDIKPLGLPVLVRVDEFVRQVLFSSVFTHLAPPTTRGLLALCCGFTQKNFQNKIQWGSDPHEGFAEVDDDGDVKNAIRVQVQVLDTVLLEETLEEVARREC
jgi:hypothetical protein